MKNFLVAALIALGACQAAPSAPAHKLGLNLGPQAAAITLTSGSNNNVAIAPNGNTTTMLRFLVNSANSTLSGMDASTVSDGDLFLVRNDSTTGKLIITNEDTNSLAANRFLTIGAVSLDLGPKSSALVERDVTTGRWIASLAKPESPVLAGVTTNGTANLPTLSTCGTSPTIAAGSTSFAGTYTTGSAATTCTITFATAFSAAPTCLILSAGGAATLVPTYSTSTTAITVATDIASTAYQYVCVGH